ncbi:MAG: DUF3094 domain-containing protein [Cellvibrionaceae bacterium]|nr:DUF3094 domain-containing protein [Cellvibrionaceae bacterium]MCV6625296.1 DUF3094 domain-containing protein [Cellvibrionaceae bacterium]
MATVEDGPKLSAEDQARVDRVINSGVNSIERKPFRPWRLLLLVWLVLFALGLTSWLIARAVGVV